MRGSGIDRIGLTEERVRTKCELRLRQSGLQPVVSEAPYPALVITIQVLAKDTFVIEIQFYRVILFEVNGVPYSTIAPTWEHWGTGKHGNDSEYIIKTLDQFFDVFLNEYLKANVK